MQNPFDEQPPHPVAVEAARALMAELSFPAEGKMYGVLVAHDGTVLRAFSAGVDAPGFAPHVFDAAARAAIEPQAGALGNALTERLRSLLERDAAVCEVELERARLKALHAERRRLRHTQPRTSALDEQSRADNRERK